MLVAIYWPSNFLFLTLEVGNKERLQRVNAPGSEIVFPRSKLVVSPLHFFPSAKQSQMVPGFMFVKNRQVCEEYVIFSMTTNNHFSVSIYLWSVFLNERQC